MKSVNHALSFKDPGAGWFGKAEIIDFKKLPMIELYKKFSLSEECIDFVGHACALELNDELSTCWHDFQT